MKKNKTRTIPEKTETVVDYIECEICGKRTDDSVEYGVNEWADHHYSVSRVAIYSEKGKNYPDHRFGEYKIYDVCDDCFEEHIVPFLESLGANHRTEEYDYN